MAIKIAVSFNTFYRITDNFLIKYDFLNVQSSHGNSSYFTSSAFCLLTLVKGTTLDWSSARGESEAFDFLELSYRTKRGAGGAGPHHESRVGGESRHPTLLLLHPLSVSRSGIGVVHYGSYSMSRRHCKK